LINKTSDLGVLTKSVDGVDGLFFLSSGPIPPNPAELISNKRTSELFSELRKQYDYVVIDAPPVGVVTDALLLSTYTDANLYVIRQNYTLKSQLELVVELSKQKKMSNMGIIVNDVKKQSGYGYSYSYGYGYS
jgi:capsular exopolysaccharide synthesis family protein